MKKRLLLCVDGSAQSGYAAELCFKLATSGWSLTAQHVIDSVGIWSYLAHDLPGIIGSGPFLTARESIVQQLRDLGDTLLEHFEILAAGHTVNCTTQLDEGNPLSEICRRTLEHELVVVGHRPTGILSPQKDRRRFPRYSTAEKLAQYCLRPLLVIQQTVSSWRSITLLLPIDKSLPNSLAWSCWLSDQMSLPLRICFYTCKSDPQELPAQIEKELQSLSDQQPQLKLSVEIVDGTPYDLAPYADLESDSLLVIPTITINGIRETAYGASPDSCIRYGTQRNLLLYPEEYSPHREGSHQAEEEIQII